MGIRDLWEFQVFKELMECLATRVLMALEVPQDWTAVTGRGASLETLGMEWEPPECLDVTE